MRQSDTPQEICHPNSTIVLKRPRPIETEAIERKQKRPDLTDSEGVNATTAPVKRARRIVSSRTADLGDAKAQPNTQPASQGNTERTVTLACAVPAAENIPHLRDPNPKMVIIEVGPENNSYTVHENHITFYTPYFKKFLEKSKMEDSSLKVDCRDVETSIFGLFVNWMYNRTIQHPGQPNPSILEIVKLWALAAKFQVPHLQNSAIKLLIDIIREEEATLNTPADPEVKAFFDLAYAPGNRSVLGKLAIHRLVRLAMMQSPIEGWLDVLEPAIHIDFSKALMKLCRRVPTENRIVGFKLKDYMVNPNVVARSEDSGQVVCD